MFVRKLVLKTPATQTYYIKLNASICIVVLTVYAKALLRFCFKNDSMTDTNRLQVH